jgi:hypothetical protein
LKAEVEELSPRNLSDEQEHEIGNALKKFWGHPTVNVESYGMDGEGTALAWQIILAIHEGTGRPAGDGRADKIVSGGFEWGVAIRGPESELPFMNALQGALTSIGKLKRVEVNGLQPPTGAGMSGNAGMSGRAAMGGGGGPMRPPVIPTSGPVIVTVGIRPPPHLPIAGN